VGVSWTRDLVDEIDKEMGDKGTWGGETRRYGEMKK